MLVVTGGGGFIGSVLTARLNAAGHDDIVIVDRFGEGEKWRNIAKPDFCEIMTIERLMDWLECFGGSVDAVFHLGAISSTTVVDADTVIAANLNYSIALWLWCAQIGKRLVYASSSAAPCSDCSPTPPRSGARPTPRLSIAPSPRPRPAYASPPTAACAARKLRLILS
jgi:nucleoside-diphosphate-sugar epimerase